MHLFDKRRAHIGPLQTEAGELVLHRDLQVLVPRTWAKANLIRNRSGAPLILEPDRQCGWSRQTTNPKGCIWDPQPDYLVFGARESSEHGLQFTGQPRPSSTQMLLAYQIQLVQQPDRDTDRWLCGILPRDRHLWLRDRTSFPPGTGYETLTYMTTTSNRLLIQNDQDCTEQECAFQEDRVAFLYAPSGAVFHVYHIYGLEL